jgi:hypothetical protein
MPRPLLDRARDVPLYEQVEHLGHEHRVHADPGVAHTDDREVPLAARLEGDASARGGELDRGVQQVRDHLFQSGGVATQPHGLGSGQQVERDTAPGHLVVHGVGHPRHELVEQQRLHWQLNLAERHA